MNLPEQLEKPPAAPPRTAGHEFLTGLWQFGLLSFLSIAVLIVLIMVAGEGHLVARKRASVERQLQDSRGIAESRAVQAMLRRSEMSDMPSSPAKPPSAAQLEKLAAAVSQNAPAEVATPAQPSPAGSKDPQGDRATPSTLPPNVVPESLLATIKQGNWAGTNAIIGQMEKLGEFEGNRPALRDACIEMLNGNGTQQRECFALIDLATAWNDKKLADAILACVERGPQQFAGATSFDQLARLAATADRERLARVLPQVANAQMTRPSGNPLDVFSIIPQYATFASIVPADSPAFDTLIVSNSPPGDVVRGALSLRDKWPESMLKEFAQVLSNSGNPFRVLLLIWLEQSPRPPEFADKLLPFALRSISRQDDGDISDELFGIHLVVAATHEKSASRIAASSVRLMEKNPEAAKQLLLMMLLSYPDQAIPAFVQAAEAGNPILPPDMSAACWAAERAKPPARGELRVPGIALEQVRDFVDSMVAPELAKSRPADWQRGLVIFAGDWGGPVTLGILKHANQAEVKRAQLSELVKAAQQKIEGRAKSLPIGPGGAK